MGKRETHAEFSYRTLWNVGTMGLRVGRIILKLLLDFESYMDSSSLGLCLSGVEYLDSTSKEVTDYLVNYR
jgi:hypothetical protein